MSLKSTVYNISRHRLLYYSCPWFRTLPGLTIILFISVFASLATAQTTKWVGTWSTAPQLVEPGNNPPSPGLSNNTLRQIVRVSIGGDTLRMRFSNEFSTSSVTLNEVHIAVSLGGRDTIDPATDAVLLFSGEKVTTIEPGSATTSDPFHFPLRPRTDVAITIYFGSTSPEVTGHPGSRTTSYLLVGNEVSRADFPGAVTTDHWYVINTIDVLAPDSAAAVAIIGNSITDGRGSGTNKQNRWPDELARRFQEHPGTQQVAVLNQGIGGNCVLGMCLGPSALSRFNRDVIEQSGVRWLIILEGINDIGNGGAGVGNSLINAYTQMIHYAHSNGIFVYGATLLPMKGSFYYSTQHEAERQIVNEWIRTTDLLDGMIDLDKALCNPADTLSLRPEADTGDHLHPNETGHRLMAEAVDLNLFVGRDSLDYTDESITVYFESECATVGESWDILSDAQASNEKYVTVKPGLQSLSQAPTGSESLILISFSVDTTGNYSVFARLHCPTPNDDSFWIKMDDGAFQLHNGLGTSGWEWRKLDNYMLTEGDHTLTVAYREDGAKLDKIGISNSAFAPLGMGEKAENVCVITGVLNSIDAPDGYALGQNYPNPFNPSTTITFTLPVKTFATLKVYDALGREVSKLFSGEMLPGTHSRQLSAEGLTSGTYFFRLQAGSYIETKKFVLAK